jgi:hypothetical protein
MVSLRTDGVLQMAQHSLQIPSFFLSNLSFTKRFHLQDTAVMTTQAMMAMAAAVLWRVAA